IEVIQVGDDASRFNHARRFVAPAAKWDWREKRAIGFNEQPVERYAARDGAQRLGVLKRDVAGKRDQQTEFEGRFGQRPTAAEAVHDAAKFRPAPFSAQDRRRVYVSFARVNDHGQLRRTRQTQLPREDFALRFARRVVVMIIEANLAPSQHARTAAHALLQTLRRPFISQTSIVRMHTGCRIDAFIAFSNLKRTLQWSTVRIARTHIQNRNDTGRTRTRHDLIAIRVVLRPVYMRV